jgi:hypothetical protein
MSACYWFNRRDMPEVQLAEKTMENGAGYLREREN